MTAFGFLAMTVRKSTNRRLRRASAALPVLNGVETEAEAVGEAFLRHAEVRTNILNVDLFRHGHLEAFSPTAEEPVNLRQALLKIVKHFAHYTAPHFAYLSKIKP